MIYGLLIRCHPAVQELAPCLDLWICMVHIRGAGFLRAPVMLPQTLRFGVDHYLTISISSRTVDF